MMGMIELMVLGIYCVWMTLILAGMLGILIRLWQCHQELKQIRDAVNHSSYQRR